MKVNGVMISVIKLATICLCINSVLSAALSDGQSSEGSNEKITTVASTTLSAVETSPITEEDYDNASQEKSSTSETLDTKQPPLVFPSDDEKTETSKNETALEILQKNSNASTMESKVVTDSPSTADADAAAAKDDDETKKDAKNDVENDNNTNNETSQQPQQQSQEKTENDYDNLVEDEENEKNDVENIQDDKDQGYLEEQFGFNSTSINPFEEPTLKGGHIAVIFASALVFLSVAAYIGLVLWRNRLESRYGMRQQLVTEDDYYNNNDVRFFGL